MILLKRYLKSGYLFVKLLTAMCKSKVKFLATSLVNQLHIDYREIPLAINFTMVR